MDRLRTSFAIMLLLLPLAVFAKDQVIRIVPQPESIELVGGTFKAIGAGVNCDAAFDAASRMVAQDFAARMSLVTGKVSSFAVGTVVLDGALLMVRYPDV